VAGQREEKSEGEREATNGAGHGRLRSEGDGGTNGCDKRGSGVHGRYVTGEDRVYRKP
jgi:hypothetical protein